MSNQIIGKPVASVALAAAVAAALLGGSVAQPAKLDDGSLEVGDVKVAEFLDARDAFDGSGLTPKAAIRAAEAVALDDSVSVDAIRRDTSEPVRDAISLFSDAKARADVKGAAWADVEPHRFISANGDLIEIVSSEAIDGGVQLFAKAWDANDDPIGFGADGTVETERFRFHNPPILVPDGTTREESVDGNPSKVDNFAEDVGASIESELGKAVRNAGRYGAKIASGTIGRTTDVFYPETGTGGASMDSSYQRIVGTGTAWATLKAGAGTDVAATGTIATVRMMADATANWRRIGRVGFTFDTTSVPSGDTVSSVTFTVTGNNKADPDSNAPSTNLYAFTPADYGTVAAADFTQFGTTAYSTAISYASWNTSGTNSYALNATGLAAYSKAAKNGYGLRNVEYDVGSSTPTWGSGNDTNVVFYMADQTGTTSDPSLTVVHAGATTFVPISITF